MTGWDTGVLNGELRYDGLGRPHRVSVGGILTEAFDYDDGSTLVRHSLGNPITGSPNQTLSFQDWELDTATGVATERHTPFSATRGPLREWHFRELNGHVAATFNDAGASLSSRRFGTVIFAVAFPTRAHAAFRLGRTTATTTPTASARMQPGWP